jgi:Holliday junction resolvasome RuvABC endonuclease subunit
VSTIIAIDPSIAKAGVACFDLRNWRTGESFAQVVRRLSYYAVVRTAPGDPICERLGQIARRLREIIFECGPERVYIEKPSTAGVYWKRRQRQFSKTALNAADLEKLNMAIGALVAAAEAEDVDVTLVPASTVDKKLRLKIVRAQLRDQKHPLALSERVSPDLLDAIYLGAFALTSPKYQPALAS